MKPRTTTGADTLRRARRTEKWVARGNVLGLPIKGNWTETSICPIQIAILGG
jgi:hypothetical protein